MNKMSNLREIRAKREELSEFLMKIIDCSLKEIFGEHAVSIIYDYMERRLSLRREEIPERIEDFREGLREFLSTGACVVEKAILKKLYKNYGLDFEEEEDQGFEYYIRELKRRIRKETKR